MSTPSDRAKSIFLNALEVSPAAGRQVYVTAQCGGDEALRREVEDLLGHHAGLGDFLEPGPPPAAAAGVVPGAAERPGAVIGPYKLLEEIGEGGFGVVFMAEQLEPIRRKVALKILKPGMDTRQVINRFEAERQALALMDHANIAKVLDAGQTDSGRPYFVMDLVRGLPITEFCDQERLAPAQRLELFVHVCSAVQHAHQKGIIHRDLKPSNVLVTVQDGKPLVKVIDFGIAKALDRPLTDKTLFTGFAQLIGTPLYMAPEQAALSNVDVDTRSDVYSLGVLLYELLTGTTPFEKERFKEVGYDEMRRIIREEDPPRPSTRVSTLGQAATTASTRRQSDPRRLSQLFRGELDWIVMKALDKDRSRRYESASAFAADVQRYLNDEPVQACPPSAWYRLGKLVRRNKSKVAVAAAMLALVLAGAAVSAWQAVRATLAEQQTGEALAQVKAEQEKTEAALAAARQALDALTGDVVETMFARQPELDEPEKAFLRKVLGHYEAVAPRADRTAAARFLRAKGQFQVAHLRQLLGEPAEAVAGYRQAALLLKQLADESPGVADYRHKLARAHGNLGILLAEAGQMPEAEAALRQGIALRTKLAADSPENTEYRVDLAKNLNDLGVLLERKGNPVEAGKAYREALDRHEKLAERAPHVPGHRQDLARARSNLGQFLRKQGDFAEAEKLYGQAITAQEEQRTRFPNVPKSRRLLADSYHGLGIVLAERQRPDEAEKAFRRAVQLRESLAGDFPKVVQYRRELARTYGDLGYLLGLQKKYGPAEQTYRQALDVQEKLVAERGTVAAYRQDAAQSYGNLATLYLQRQDAAGAVPLLEKARAHLRAALNVNAKNPIARRFYRENQRILAKSYLALGDHTRLAATADDLADFGFAPAEDTYAAACMLSRCAALAAKDAGLAPNKASELAESYTDRALARLRQAVERGYQDAARMQQDPHLEPLRERQPFRALLAELEGKRK